MLKKVGVILASCLLSFTSLLVLAPVVVHAAADTCTWTGTAGDHKFSTAGNWTGCDNGSVPDTSGDALVFPSTVTDKAPANDIPSLSVTSITFNGAAAQTGVNITGSAFTLTNGITSSAGNNSIANGITLSGNQSVSVASTLNFSLSGVLSGSGNLSKTGTGILFLGGANTTYSGAITVSAGSLYATDPAALGTTAAGTTVSAGGDLRVSVCSSPLTVAENLTLTGASSDTTGDFPIPKLSTSASPICAGFGADESYGVGNNGGSVTLSGDITLGSDVTFGASSDTTLTGNVTGGFGFTMLAGYGAKLINGTTTQSPAVFEKTLSDAVPANSVSIVGNTIITIDGTRGDTNVTGSGATLKGTGTVGVLNVGTGATVAPGHSPGCLTSGNFTLAGTYEAELGGTDPCTSYDQMKVTGTVDLTDGTLNVSLYNNFKPEKGQKYTIIDNDAADAVTSQFTGLAEGATVTSGEYSFKISYVGGDGNDVVLSVIGVPNTGAELLTAHPIITLISTTFLALGIALIARRYNKVLSR